MRIGSERQRHKFRGIGIWAVLSLELRQRIRSANANRRWQEFYN